MKIAYIVKSFPEISQTFITVQIAELIKAGNEVVIYSQYKPSTPEIDLVREYNLINNTFYALSIPKNKHLRRYKAFVLILQNLLKNPHCTCKALTLLTKEGWSYENLFFFVSFKTGKFDAIQCHFGPAGNLGLFLKRSGLFKGKLITTFHGYDVSSYIKQKGKDIYKKLFELGDCFTYNSESTKAKLIALGCDSSRMYKIPMGIQVEKFKFKRREINLDKPINILSVGRLVEMKGRKYAIEAVAELIKSYPQIKYYIVGDGECRQDLEQQIHNLGLEDFVELTGWVSSEKLTELYDKAHIFLHPSITAPDGNQEGQGMVLIEAQAQGIPVVATRHGAFTETIIENETGILVDEASTSQLVEKINQLLPNANLIYILTKKAYKRLEIYDSKNICKKLEELMESKNA